MPVPETPMNEDNLFVFGDYYIRVPWENILSNSEPISHAIYQRTYYKLRLSIVPPDRTHYLASLMNGKYVSHHSLSVNNR